MDYTLAQVLEDKKLRAALAGGEIIFYDGNGVFELDFQENSIRKNHRAVFDRLCELGGEALLASLLEADNTCLTDDPNAANQGVRPIQGTDRYFLKTAAGDPTALASILHGIIGWAETDPDFDLDAVILNDGEDELWADLPLSFDEPEEESVPQWTDSYSRKLGEGLPVRNCTLATKGGKTSFYDEDANAFVSLTCADGENELCLDSFYACEELEFEGLYTFGYKYKLSEEGKWGYISCRFTQILPPTYEDILVSSNPESCLIGIVSERADSDTIDLHFSGSVSHPEIDGEDTWMPVPSEQASRIFAGYPRSVYYPETDAVYAESRQEKHETDELSMFSLSERATFDALYLPKQDSSFGCFQHISEIGCRVAEAIVRYSNGLFTMKQYGSGKQSTVAPASELSLSLCSEIFAGSKKEYETIDCLVLTKSDNEWEEPTLGTYVIRKDGYYAVAQLDVTFNRARMERLLTPFAFTKITAAEGSQVLVDRFGKKGIFDWSREEYIIPCEYESIKTISGFLSWSYQVEKAGFTGEISSDGVWNTPLHRNEG